MSQAQFTPDGSQIVLTSGAGVWVWPVLRDTIGQGPPINIDPRANRIPSADGRRLLEWSYIRGQAVPTTEAASARILDVTTGQNIAGPVALPADAASATAPCGSPVSAGRPGRRVRSKPPGVRPDWFRLRTQPDAFFWDVTTDRMLPLPLQVRLPTVPVPLPVAVLTNLGSIQCGRSLHSHHVYRRRACGRHNWCSGRATGVVHS